MLRLSYDQYLSYFNKHDYDGVLSFWSQEFEACFGDVILRNGADLKRFYRFFHHHVTERIEVLDFVSDEQLVALRATVRIEGRRELSQEALSEAGYGGLHAVQVGQIIEIPQLMMYRLEQGKFTQVYCAVV